MSSLKDSIAPLESDLKAIPPRINVYHDLPFAIMRYDPKDEWELRREIELLATRLKAACPQCGYQCANQDFDWRMNEESFSCRYCGYQEYWDTRNDEIGRFTGWKHEATRGAGALFYKAANKVTCCVRFRDTSKEVV